MAIKSKHILNFHILEIDWYIFSVDFIRQYNAREILVLYTGELQSETFSAVVVYFCLDSLSRSKMDFILFWRLQGKKWQTREMANSLTAWGMIVLQVKYYDTVTTANCLEIIYFRVHTCMFNKHS